MLWNNLKLFYKILIGVGVVLLLLSIISYSSYNNIGYMISDARQVIEGNKLKGVLLQRQIDHHNWVNNLSLYLHDDAIQELSVELDHTQCGLGKWLYSEQRKFAEQQVPGLAPLFSALEKPHKKLHETAIEISRLHHDVSYQLPLTLSQLEVDHLVWAQSVQHAILDNKSGLDVQLNPRKCNLGEFLYSDQGRQFRVQNPEFEPMFKTLEPVHNRLHESGRTISELLESGDTTAAKLAYSMQLVPALTSVQQQLDLMAQLAREQLAHRQQASDVFSQQTQPLLKEVVGQLNQLIDEASANILSEDQMVTNGVNTGRFILMLSVIAIILGIGVALFLARRVSEPVLQVVRFARQVTSGDLTQSLHSDHRDEIGQLINSLGEMVNKLREVVVSVLNSSDEVSTGSNMLLEKVQSLSSGANQQAASIEETSSALEQMSANVTQNADNARQTEKMASSSAQDAEEGGRVVGQTIDAMHEIASKIEIIEDIAYETKILALNAAIEAARAGEHGKGFSVVASEVRKLAGITEEAAKNISDLTGNSVTISNQAGEMLKKMLPSIEKTAALVQEISASSDEQATGINEISSAMTQLDEVSQVNAALSDELAGTASRMSNQAEQLEKVVRFFKVGTQ